MRVPFRLPVDRVFSVDGFGTVVTGTLIEGAMHEGDPAELTPSGVQTRIRNLQVHGRDVETAYAGQRVAVNLSGLKKTDIRRGDTVAKPDTVRVSRMLDVRLQNLADSNRVIRNDTQVHFYHGAAVLLAKVVLLDRDALRPGESCYAQLRLTEPVASKNGDRFVVRAVTAQTKCAPGPGGPGHSGERLRKRPGSAGPDGIRAAASRWGAAGGQAADG